MAIVALGSVMPADLPPAAKMIVGTEVQVEDVVPARIEAYRAMFEQHEWAELVKELGKATQRLLEGHVELEGRCYGWRAGGDGDDEGLTGYIKTSASTTEKLFAASGTKVVRLCLNPLRGEEPARRDPVEWVLRNRSESTVD